MDIPVLYHMARKRKRFRAPLWKAETFLVENQLSVRSGIRIPQ